MSEASSVSLAQYRRASGCFGREVRYFAETGSTNDVLAAEARAGAAEGLVVLADRQTVGRGRLDRRWYAPAGTSLLMSLLFRPPAPFARSSARVLMISGLSLVSAVRSVAGIQARLKWPNDLIYAPAGAASPWKKLAGMLSEVVLDELGQPEALIVGIGLNVNLAPEALSALAPVATSLLAVAGEKVDRVDVLDAFLTDLDRWYQQLRCGANPLGPWRKALAWLGEPVTAMKGDTPVVGVAEDVDNDGALILRLPTGKCERFLAGDVSLRLTSS